MGQAHEWVREEGGAGVGWFGSERTVGYGQGLSGKMRGLGAIETHVR